MFITLRQGLESIIVHELVNWSELATAGLQHLLGHHATKASTYRTEVSTACLGECTDDVFVEIAKLEITRLFIIDHTQPNRFIITIVYLPPSPWSLPSPSSPIRLHPHHSRDKAHDLPAPQTNPEREQRRAERRHGQIYRSP